MEDWKTTPEPHPCYACKVGTMKPVTGEGRSTTSPNGRFVIEYPADMPLLTCEGCGAQVYTQAQLAHMERLIWDAVGVSPPPRMSRRPTEREIVARKAWQDEFRRRAHE